MTQKRRKCILKCKVKNVREKPDKLLKAQTFFSIIKLIPDHRLKTKKEQQRIMHRKKIKILLLNLCSHLCHSTFLSRVNFFFLSFEGCTCSMRKFPGQGLNQSCSHLAYTTATATPELSLICDLHQSSWQSWIFNLLSEARDRTCVLMDTSQIRLH